MMIFKTLQECDNFSTRLARNLRNSVNTEVSAPGFLNGIVALANATTNGFPMIQISGSSDRAIVDLQQGDYEELDQMNAAKPYTKAAFRVSKPEDIGIGVARRYTRRCQGGRVASTSI
jgi:thiamine pyrophosphate-dependent acetolactate synthase large subunit-like protein